MSRGPADQVNAKELSARAAVLQRSLHLDQLERVRDAGGLPGTRIDAQLRFGTFEGHATVRLRIVGTAVLACQRCLGACECPVDETEQLVVVADDELDGPNGYEPFVGTPEQLSLTALIEEQVLLALPLVPMHAAGAPDCSALASGARAAPEAARDTRAAAQAAADEKQTPFANLRDMLEKKHGRDR